MEGPLEQTLESIRAVKDARVSMIVAINKIDKPGANIEATKKALYDAGVQVPVKLSNFALLVFKLLLIQTQHIFANSETLRYILQ